VSLQPDGHFTAPIRASSCRTQSSGWVSNRAVVMQRIWKASQIQRHRWQKSVTAGVWMRR
jgi:hypothetical protein